MVCGTESCPGKRGIVWNQTREMQQISTMPGVLTANEVEEARRAESGELSTRRSGFEVWSRVGQRSAIATIEFQETHVCINQQHGDSGVIGSPRSMAEH